MSNKTLSALALLFICCAGAADARWAETILHSFNNKNGISPVAGPILDKAGNLYGTTLSGGKFGHGLVFELSPPGAGKTAWTETILCDFKTDAGEDPYGSLIFDDAGNLYGTTAAGGRYGEGTAFELSPHGARSTTWTETVLFSFHGRYGRGPLGSLIFDASGNLYGTASAGGPNGAGTVFELSPPGQGTAKWTETVLFAFNKNQGWNPKFGVIFDAAGNLYGTTGQGGPFRRGVAFELSPPAGGAAPWTETDIFDFNHGAGEYPAGGLIFDAAGNLYGATALGRKYPGDGTVFELSPPLAGQTAWTETILHVFKGAKSTSIATGLIWDGAGNLYGATSNISGPQQGTIFEISPPGPGQTMWTETDLHTFSLRDGFDVRGLVFDSIGSLYGTAFEGGKFGDGDVFKLTP